MDALEQTRRLFAHNRWADASMLAAVRHSTNPEAWREFSHILGAQEVWLARLEQRGSSSAVWPTLTIEQAESLHNAVTEGYADYLDRISAERLTDAVTYTNS